MPDASTQTEIKDTHRDVYTQCGEPTKVVAVVTAEFRQLPELKTQAREINEKKRRKPTRKIGMSVSEVQTDRRRDNQHRKGTETENWEPKTEEEEVTVLKIINHIKHESKMTQAVHMQRHKTNSRQKKLSRQEMLYADILANQIKGVKRRTNGENAGKENKERKSYEKKRKLHEKERSRVERRRVAEKADNAQWVKRFREWTPGQEWPIVALWGSLNVFCL